jgi:hypothetical protein
MKSAAGKLTGELFKDQTMLALLDKAFWDNAIWCNNGCLLWQKGFNIQGYGIFFTPRQICKLYPNLRMTYRANRLAYVLSTKSPIPIGKIIRHTCDNPPCIAPLHLLEGTHQDNSNDMKFRKRALYGEKNHATHLSVDDVKEIRKLYAAGGISMPRLAKDFAVTYNAIFQIINLNTWKNI